MTSDLARLRVLNLMHVANIINLPMWRSEAKQAMDEYFDHIETLADQLGEAAESIERWLRAVEEVQRLRREGEE